MDEEIIIWKNEANSIIRDIKHHVVEIEISEKLKIDDGVYLNLTTLEENHFCILLNPSGFKICSRKYDDISKEEGSAYETIYALLQSISPLYVDSFGSALLDSLNNLTED